jgi:hypothetical protein
MTIDIKQKGLLMLEVQERKSFRKAITTGFGVKSNTHLKSKLTAVLHSTAFKIFLAAI